MVEHAARRTVSSHSDRSRRMTRPAHIAMVSTPFPGHVNPSLEIIRELAARGHRVTYANDAVYADRIAATGAEPVVYRSTLPHEGTEHPSDWPEDPAGQMAVFLDDSIAMLPQLTAVYDEDRPDLVLYDITGYTGRVLAERYGVPAVQLSPSAVAWEGYEEDMAEFMESVRATPTGASYFERFERWLADSGVADTDPQRFSGRPDRCLALIPRAMQPNADRVDPDRYTFVGPCLPLDLDEGWQRPADGSRVALVSLGSTFTDQPDLYRECLRAFGDLPGWRLVLQIGKHVDEAALGPIPGNVEVHRWVPQKAILKEADLFVTHAGSGGANEGLYYGVPMIAVPQAVDQFMNADRLVELGVARRLDTAEATAPALREALDHLTTSPDVATALKRIRTETAEEGGTRRATDLIETYLS
ncbi:macrolide family glycosyltransferase [Actinomadura kijaniata]|uniref:macrolide family glycosyltransferase n=1 Tax=Actinomadura kijaniata TaxID=46161 RepID=UPI00082F8221